MNYWTEQSIAFANQKNYLDELFKVYPISPNIRRELAKETADTIRTLFSGKDNKAFLSALLSLELFPIKDSYVPYLRKDASALNRNPETVNRIAGNLRHMGLEEIFERCTEPKETNRQIGPMFKKWIDEGPIGTPIFKDSEDFIRSKGNAILNVSDAEMMEFAKKYLGYNRMKGLDFIARFNKKYIIGEAKFITDFGGHQNAQFDDAISTITSKLKKNKLNVEVVRVAIMDGVLYIKGKNKMFSLLEKNEKLNILSSLLLREFLYSL